MRRHGSTSNATLHAEAAPPRARIQPLGRRGGGLYLTTALVGVGLCLMQVPAEAKNVRLRDTPTSATTFSWNLGTVTPPWRDADATGFGENNPVPFENGDTVILHNFSGITDLTLEVTETVVPGFIQVDSSEYTITSTAGGLLQGAGTGTDSPTALRFAFRGTDNVLTVNANMAGLILVNRGSPGGGSGGTLTYGGDSTTARVTVTGGTTLNITGRIAATAGAGAGDTGFAIGANSTLEIAAGGEAEGDVVRTGPGANNTTLVVNGTLTGGVTGIRNVDIGDDGTVSGAVTASSGLTVGIVGSAAPGGAAVGQVATTGSGIVTIEGELTATGIGGIGASISENGAFHASNGGGILTTAGTFLSAGTLGSSDAADGTTGIKAELIKLTGGSIVGDVAFDGEMEVGIAGVALDYNDVLRDSLTVKAGGVVSIAAGADFDATGAAIIVEGGGSFTASQTVTNVAAVQTAGTFTIDAGKSLTAQSVLVTGGGTTIAGTGTLALSDASAKVLLQGGTLTVEGTVQARLTATGGLLKLDGGTIAGDLSLKTNAELAGAVGAIVLEAGAEGAYGATTTGNLTADSLTQKGGTFTIASGHQLDTGTVPVLVQGGRLVVAGSAGDITVEDGGTLQLDGGEAAGVTNRGDAFLHGNLVSLDNQADGDAHVDGTLAIIAGGFAANAGTLTIDLGARLDMAAALQNSGTLVLNGEAGGVINTGTVRVEGTGAGIATSITNTGGAVLVQAGGTLTVASISGGDVTVQAAGGQIGSIAGNVTTDGTVTLSGGMITGNLTTSGTASLAGTIGGTLTATGGTVTMTGAGPGTSLTLGGLQNNGAAIAVDNGATVAMTGGGAAVNDGGTLTIDGNLNVTGAANSRLDNAATVIVNGSVTGGLRQTAGTTTIVQNRSVSGQVSITGGSAEIGGSVGSVTVSGTGSATITGTGSTANNVLVLGGSLTSSGTIGGDLTNNSTAQLSGSVGGNLLGTGATTLNGSLLSLGGMALTGSGSLTVAGGQTVTLQGGTATLDGSSQLLLTGGTFAGDVDLTGAGVQLVLGNGATLEGDVTATGGMVSVAAGATVGGTLTNLAGITGATAGADTLLVRGDLLGAGAILSGGGTLVITVLGHYDTQLLDNLGAGVTLSGDILNSGTWDVTTDHILSGGNLLNANSGVINVGASANLGLDGNNLDNDGAITVATGSKITDVAILTNNGTLTNQGSIAAVSMVNEGTFTSTGTLAGSFTNRNLATLSGTAAQVVNANHGVLNVTGALAVASLTNQAGGKVTVTGSVNSTNLRNAAGGTFTSTGTLLGNFRNEGTATLSGVAATVVNAGGSMNLGGNLSVAVLTNQAALTVGTGRALTLTGGMLNDTAGTMSVYGSVTGPLANKGALTIVASGSVGAVTNQAGGVLTLRGNAGTVTNMANGQVEVTAPTAVVATMSNQGALRIGAAGKLTATSGASNGGTMLVTGAFTGSLANTGTLTSSGSLTGDVTNSGTAQLAGVLTGSYTSTGGQTAISRNLALTGPLAVQGGVVQVKVGATLSALTNPVAVGSGGRLAVSGELAGAPSGAVVNDGTLVSYAGSRIVGQVTNNGTAQLAGNITGLDSAGTVFVHGNLTVGTLASSGKVTVAAGKVMTVGAGSVGGQTVVAGTLSGPVTNTGDMVVRGTASGVTNAAGASLVLAGGTLANAVNAGSLQISQQTRIGAGGLENTGTIKLMATARLTVQSQIHNAATGTMTVASASQIAGTIANDGLLVSSGTLSGALNNGAGGTARLSKAAGMVTNAAGGAIQTNGSLAVAGLSNAGTVFVGSGHTLSSGALLETVSGGVTTVVGALDARMLVQAGGRLVSTGRLFDSVTVEGEARLAGRAADVTTEAGSTSFVTGALTMATLSNAGTATVQAGVAMSADLVENLAGGVMTIAGGAVVQSEVYTDEGSQLMVAGRVQGNIDNSGQLIGQGGSVSGNVTLRPTGTITGALNIEGQLIIAQLQPVARGFSLLSASSAEEPAVLEPIVLKVNGMALFDVGPLSDPLAESSVIEAGSVVVLNDGAVIEPTGDLTVFGTLVADTTNMGALTIGAPGLVTGNVLTSGTFALAGRVNGNVTYQGGTMSFASTGNISGDLVLEADHAFGSGEEVGAGRLVINDGATLSVAGSAPTTLLLRGYTDEGGVTHPGELVNNGAVSLANGVVGDVVTVAGALSGDGIYRLDTDMGAGTADMIDVTGGPVTGRLTFDISEIGGAEPDFGQKATLLRWDTAYNSANSYTLADPLNLPAATERVVYLVSADSAAGEIQLISAVNPAIGAISGNIVLTQSLIGAVINRPSSPYTTGIGFDTSDKACRVGSWGRAVGGTADASGATRGAALANGDRISIESQIDAKYHGFQVGTDLGCYDARFADWTVVGGAIIGMNSGSTTQPVFSVDPLTWNATSEVTSVNDADFDQKYAGVYLSAMKGSWVVDLQLRREWTEFTLNNTPQPGSLGLRLTDARFDSRATTVSGSVGYSMPLGAEDSGWSVTPTAGFAWTRTSTDTIVFDDGSTLALDDSQTKIGFVGAGVSRTKLGADGRSALSLFASGTWYKDFAKPAESTFTLAGVPDSDPQRLSSDNLGSFGEVSFGASYVRLLDGAGPIKQLNATIRVDGRTGHSLDSYGITGQLRLQF